MSSISDSLTAYDKSTLISLIQKQAEKIDILNRQLGNLNTSLVALSASWYNNESFDEPSARLLLDYLYSCRPVSEEIEEVYRAVYYSAGTSGRRRSIPVPPPPFEVAPSLNSNDSKSESSSVVRQGNYWRSTCKLSGLIEYDQELLRIFIGENLFKISARRVDLYERDKEVFLTIYDSDDPSAKTSVDCIKEFCDLLNEASLAVAPTGLVKKTMEWLDLRTWKFLGMANDMAQLYNEFRGYKNTSESSNKHWRRNHE
jgi:hypothetical protein